MFCLLRISSLFLLERGNRPSNVVQMASTNALINSREPLLKSNFLVSGEQLQINFNSSRYFCIRLLMQYRNIIIIRLLMVHVFQIMISKWCVRNAIYRFMSDFSHHPARRVRTLLGIERKCHHEIAISHSCPCAYRRIGSCTTPQWPVCTPRVEIW